MHEKEAFNVNTLGSLHYRLATNADCAEVEKLVFEILAEYGLMPEPGGIDADLRDLEGFYTKNGGWFGVWLNESGRIAGTAGLCRLNESACELRKMYVHATARGRGFGKQILQQAIAEARLREFKRIELETAAVLKEAIGLYENFGFHRHCLGAHAAKRCDTAMVLDLTD